MWLQFIMDPTISNYNERRVAKEPKQRAGWECGWIATNACKKDYRLNARKPTLLRIVLLSTEDQKSQTRDRPCESGATPLACRARRPIGRALTRADRQPWAGIRQAG
jgi:hypothetical protein